MIFLNKYKRYFIFFLVFLFNYSNLKINNKKIKKNIKIKNKKIKSKKINNKKNLRNRIKKYKKIINATNKFKSNKISKNNKNIKKIIGNNIISSFIDKSNKDYLEEAIELDTDLNLDYSIYDENIFYDNLKYYEKSLQKIEDYKKDNKLDDLLEKDLNIIIESINYYIEKISEFNIIINNNDFNFKDLKFKDKDNFFKFIIDSLNNFINFYNDSEKNEKTLNLIKSLTENKIIIEELILKIENDEDIEYEKYKNSFIYLRNIFFEEFIILLENDLKFNYKFSFLIKDI